jgi:hypothetical protein
MRVNPKTYPVYNSLHSRLSVATSLPIDGEFEKYFKSVEEYNEFMFAMWEVKIQVQHRYFITKPFNEALQKVYPKIIEKFAHFTYDKPDAGILFANDGFTMYMVNSDPITKAILYAFSKEKLVGFAFVAVTGQIHGRWYMSYGHDQKLLEDWVHTVMATYYFINECDVTQVIVKPGQKSNTKKADPKHLYNETKEPITVLDCTWFTEIIRTDGFAVSPHGRWQWVGEGRGKLKLVSVKGYEKSGYHRSASKELRDKDPE